MNLNIVCGVTLAVSLALIVVAVAIGMTLRHSELKSTGTEGRRRVLTPFQVFLLCFFFAAVTIFCPIYYIDYLAAETGFLKVIKAFLLSVQNVLRLVTLNGDFDNVRDFLSDGTRINGVLAAVYSVYAAFMILAAPLLTAGFVLSFFRDASAMLRYSLRPCRELYVMSELNERSLALAKNILETKRRGRIVVFADVFEKDEKEHELIFFARRLGAICVKKDVTDIGLKYARRCKRKIYLIGEDEDENLEQALKLIDRHRKGKFDTKDLEFYTFCVSAESEALLDSIDNGNMKVRRVNGNFNLALGEMRSHPIFYEINDKEKVKDARIAIVGMGGYGMELVKMICCLGQMPERTVEVHVFDRDDAEQKLRTRAPELLDYNNADIEGEAKYRIVFHKTDVCGESFPEELSNIEGVTGIYVTLGEDEANVETAIRIRAALKRKNRADKTPIYAVVYDQVKADIVEKNGLTNMEGESYKIEFIGSLRKCYSTDNIEQEYLEKIALELHLAWSEKDNKEKDTEKFDHFEYYRRSSFVQAVYREWREKLIGETGKERMRQDREYNRMLRDYEHRRWNTYMRGEGYVRGVKDHIAKTHPMLVPYGNLPENEEIKDDI